MGQCPVFPVLARRAQSGHPVSVRAEEITQSSATVALTRDELVLLNNALNEVCNGVRDLDNDDEFATRLGVSREDARRLLDAISALIGQMPRSN